MIGIVLGITIGIGLALRITVLAVKKSNDVGDSKGEMRDFGTYIDMISTQDDLHSYRPSARGKLILEDRMRRITGAQNGTK